MEEFFAPGKEILVASSAEQVVSYLRRFSRISSIEIGAAMRKRALRDHTYRLRALEFQKIVEEDFLRNRTRGAEIRPTNLVRTGT